MNRINMKILKKNADLKFALDDVFKAISKLNVNHTQISRLIVFIKSLSKLDPENIGRVINLALFDSQVYTYTDALNVLDKEIEGLRFTKTKVVKSAKKVIQKAINRLNHNYDQIYNDHMFYDISLWQKNSNNTFSPLSDDKALKILKIISKHAIARK